MALANLQVFITRTLDGRSDRIVIREVGVTAFHITLDANRIEVKDDREPTTERSE